MSYEKERLHHIAPPLLASRIVGIHISTLWRYRQKNIGPAWVTLADGSIAYLISDLEAWKAAQEGGCHGDR
jgi:hypothetical protein